jgi:hypothetical protein
MTMNRTVREVLISTAFAATVLGASYTSAAPFLDLGFSLESVTIADLKTMEGKRVLGKNRELIGHLGKVDEQAKLVELKTPDAAIVSISVDALVKDGDTLAAPSLSRGDILAMVGGRGEPSIREAGALPIP